MFNHRSSHASEDRLDRPPGGRQILGWLMGACMCGAALAPSVADAQAAADTVHPAFARKLSDRAGYRAADHLLQEDECPDTGDLQHVRDYDGTLGQPRSFVDAHENPVGRFETAGLCTGTLIAQNLFLTASHCVDDLTVNSDTVTFEFEKLAGSDGTAETTSFLVTDLVQDGADVGLDFAILRLEGTPGDTFGVTAIEQFTPNVSHLLTIIQHPRGQRKQVEVGHVHSYTDNSIRYNDLDTHPGSSGSGILDDHGKLVGVHTQGGCASGGENSGTRMDRILANSQTMRDLLPPTLLAREARISLLRVHDVGTGYGPPGDSIDAEVIVWLESTGSEPYGFTLRTGTEQDTHRGMFRLLREAFRSNEPIHIEYDRNTHRTNRILRVVRK